MDPEAEPRATFRLSDAFVNVLLAASLPDEGVVRTVVVHARSGQAIDVTVTLRKPAFLPALNAHLAIVRQPALPDAPVLVLQLTGGAASLLKVAGLVGGVPQLPPGFLLEGDLILVNIGALLVAHGQAPLLAYARELQVTTEESAIVVNLVIGAAGPAGTA